MFSTNLFLSSSNFKSTTTLLKQISALLSTSSVNISRSFTHLRYYPWHAQLALDEYQYHIKSSDGYVMEYD